MRLDHLQRLFLTLSPIMSAYANPEGGAQTGMTRWVNERFDHLHRRYGALLDRVFHWRHQILVAALFFSLLAAPFYLLSQKELAPIEDQSAINIIVDAPSNASLDYSNDFMSDTVDKILSMPGVKYVWQVVTANAGFGGIIFDDTDQRDFKVQDALPRVVYHHVRYHVSHPYLYIVPHFELFVNPYYMT